MATKIIMPALGMSQETGIIIAWLKQEGDTITKGEPILEIETDKTAVELEAEASGILQNITAFAGDEVAVATTIGWIVAEGEAVIPSPPAPLPVGEGSKLQYGVADATPVAARMAQAHDLDLADVATEAGRKISKQDVLAHLEGKTAVSPKLLPASPLARRLAAKNNLSLADINGSGTDGAVLAADITRTLATQPLAPSPKPNTLPMSRAWAIAAQRLTTAWQTIPHFYLERDVVVTALVAWRELVNRRLGEKSTTLSELKGAKHSHPTSPKGGGARSPSPWEGLGEGSAQIHNEPKITYTDLLVKCVAAALMQHPRVNASWLDGEIVSNEQANVGLAAAVEDGLVVPVIHNANQLTVADIGSQRQAIVGRALAGKLRLADLEGGTFTISNLGMYGVDRFSAIVNPPQAAILAVGKIREQFVPESGLGVIRPILTLTLSCDHRVVDGARGAQFLETLVQFIQEPLTLL